MKINRVILGLAVIANGSLPVTSEVDEPAIRRLLAELLSAYLPEPEVPENAIVSYSGNYMKTGSTKTPVTASDWRVILHNFCEQVRAISVNSGASVNMTGLPVKCVDAFKQWRAGLDTAHIEAVKARLAKETADKIEAEKAKAAQPTK